LAILKLLTPEELSNPAVDEKSVMTYLAQFPKAQPLKQQQQKSSSLSISGIDRHHIVGIPSNFFVEIERIEDEIEVDITDYEGNRIEVEIATDENDDGEFKYKISFVPKNVGEHKVFLKIFLLSFLGVSEKVTILFFNLRRLGSLKVFLF